MRCHFPNPENLIDKVCGRPATWVFLASMLGYPVNESVKHDPVSLCDIHAAAAVVDHVADPTRRMAGLQLMRVEHADSFAETEALRGRRIGQ